MITGHIKNWSKFQHYKNRCPPWIKLQKDLLNDWDFARLPIASKALAPLLWLLASESTDGSVSLDVEFLAFRLHWPEPDISAGLKPLIEKGFVIVASGVLADCYHDAMPEGEGEGEGETEKACASSSDEAPPRSDPIPYQAIADLFNSIMVGLAKVREVTLDRKTMIRTAWRSSKERQTIEFWRAYFEECAADPFLNGAGPYKPPHEHWRPTFNHLMKPKVVTQVFEKALDRMEREG